MHRNVLVLTASLGLAALTGYAQQNQPQGDDTNSGQNLPPGLTNSQTQANTNYTDSTNALGSRTDQLRSDVTNSLSRFGSNLNRWSTNLFGRGSSTNQGLTPTGRDTNRTYETNGTFSRTNVTNTLSRFGSNVNRFGTNLYSRSTNYFSTNQLLSPTGRGTVTNRTYAPGTGGGTAQVKQDQAVTAQDRTLLVNIRQRIETTISTQVQAPVYFICREGVVTVTGYSPTPQEKQQILTVVQQTPGVVQVVDQVQVNTQTETAVGGATEQPYTGQGQGQYSSQEQYSSQTIQGSSMIQDQALTSTDQTLVVQLRRQISPVVGTQYPVHFVCRNGIVTIVGIAANNEQKHQIVSLVQQTPGVVQVFDKLEVSLNASGSMSTTNATGAMTTNATTGLSSTNSAAVTNAAGLATAGTNISGVNTNLSPTSRTNQENRVFEGDDRRLPPGLQKRDRLPPGLEKRQGQQPSEQSGGPGDR